MTRQHVGAAAMILAAACLAGCREQAPVTQELVIYSQEYGFHMPDTVRAGLVHITLHNHGHEIHEAALERFLDTIGTAAAFRDSIRANVDYPSNAEDAGGAALTLPGDSSGVWVRLTPGRYAVLCWKGNHMSLGMVHDLVVVPSNDREAEPPKPDRTLTLVDFGYSFDAPLTAGRHILHARNTGKEPHEADIFKATATTGLREYVAWLSAGEKGPAPMAPVAAFGDLFPGKEAWIEMRLTPGKYFMLCQAPARADGKPHYKHGMTAEFTIE
jgi:uncharacterized cupredoxin-like copper-binding protein